ncbi:hypothetical protein MKX03_026320 [Papaver bracteatum]|nr:hypothetical protein MKX03_026320 [Papaver bracteatum]
MSPRCGVPDNDDHNKLGHTTKHYSFLKADPLGMRAFSKWSSVIPVNFTETQDYKHANIKIGFYHGDHGDGYPFDDMVLAHATGPGSGAHIHFNAGITWAVDFNSEESEDAFDLESVAIHEMGHLLGLNHSSNEESVMWPYGTPRTKNIDLALNDVNGAQVLYGTFENPNLMRGESFFGLKEIVIISIIIYLLIGKDVDILIEKRGRVVFVRL